MIFLSNSQGSEISLALSFIGFIHLISSLLFLYFILKHKAILVFNLLNSSKYKYDSPRILNVSNNVE